MECVFSLGLCKVGSDQVDCVGHTGGLILLNPNATQHLSGAVNAAFLATLFADYLKAADIPVLECGPYWFSTDVLRNFSRSQVIVILHISFYLFTVIKFTL